MMRKVSIAIMAILMSILLVPTTNADELYTIQINKYEVPSNHENIIGNSNLTPLQGVRYEIVKLKPIIDHDETSNIEDYTIDESYTKKTIDTNESGIGSIDVSQGAYKVVELPGNVVTKPMEPVFVNLPTDSYDNMVKIYPKSNVIEYKEVDKIPQTSGQIGNINIIIALGMGTLLLTYIGLRKPR